VKTRDLTYVTLALDALRAQRLRTWFLNVDTEIAQLDVLDALGRLEDPTRIRKVAAELTRRRFKSAPTAVAWVASRGRELPQAPALADHLVAVSWAAAERDRLSPEEILDSVADAYRELKVGVPA
jgi:hypothetical protein